MYAKVSDVQLYLHIKFSPQSEEDGYHNHMVTTKSMVVRYMLILYSQNTTFQTLTALFAIAQPPCILQYVQ